MLRHVVLPRRQWKYTKCSRAAIQTVHQQGLEAVSQWKLQNKLQYYQPNLLSCIVMGVPANLTVPLDLAHGLCRVHY